MVVKTCERYNLTTGKWVKLRSDFDEFALYVTTVAVKHRFLFAFGGYNKDFETPENGERIARFDVRKGKSWK